MLQWSNAGRTNARQKQRTLWKYHHRSTTCPAGVGRADNKCATVPFQHQYLEFTTVTVPLSPIGDMTMFYFLGDAHPHIYLSPAWFPVDDLDGACTHNRSPSVYNRLPVQLWMIARPATATELFFNEQLSVWPSTSFSCWKWQMNHWSLSAPSWRISVAVTNRTQQRSKL